MADVAEWIQQLCAGDQGTRNLAAFELFQEGVALGNSVFAEAPFDPAFHELLSKPTVGIAVQPENFATIRAASGNPPLAEVPPDQDAMEFELHFGERARLDVLTTKAPGGGGAIDRFLRKFGEGIQQVEYLVPDVDRATQILRERFGLKPIYPETRPGADGTRVNFFLVPTPSGKKVLIELVEEKK